MRSTTWLKDWAMPDWIVFVCSYHYTIGNKLITGDNLSASPLGANVEGHDNVVNLSVCTLVYSHCYYTI